MKKHLILFLTILCHTIAFGQEYSNKPVTIDERTFLPYMKGKVVNRIAKNDVNCQKIFNILQSSEIISKPQGYKVDAYSDGNNSSLEVSLSPYWLDNQTIFSDLGSNMKIYLNDIKATWNSLIKYTDIYLAPVKVGDFMGYPIYKLIDDEKVMIYKGTAPLFLPVSREEYLTALINSEVEKQKEYDTAKSSGEISDEVGKAYQELLKVDKAAAAEYKKEMESFKKDLNESENNKPEDLVSSLKKELANLSPTQRKQQAYYDYYAIGEDGNLSGLVDEGEEATSLVKPNYNAFSKNSRDIYLISLAWTLIDTSEHENHMPRLYQPKNSLGWALTDYKMYELYNNEMLWKEIIKLVR